MLFEYNIKIVYRLKSQNIKINALTRIIKFKFINSQNERLKTIILNYSHIELIESR